GVPENPQEPAAPDGQSNGEVVRLRRRTGGPYQRPRIPRIIPRRLAAEVRPNQIASENQYSRGLKEDTQRDDQIPDVPTPARLIGVDPAGHAQKPGDMHEIERQMEADNK